MRKKLIAACLGLVIFAVTLPTIASASPELTLPTGTRLATGTKIKATNVGNSLFKNDEGTSTLSECTSTVLTGEVTKNTGTQIEGTITTATASGTGSEFKGMNECTGTFGNYVVTSNGGGVDGENVTSGTPWCIRATNEMALDEFQIRGGKCSEASRKITFIIDLTVFGGSTECKYERAAASPLRGTFTTDATGEAILTTTAGVNTTVTGEAGNNFICPATGTLQLAYTLEADEAAAKPMYIS